MQSQLQSFQRRKSVVWVTDGRGKDTKRYVLFIICFAFVASRAVFLDCAPLFVVTGETLFLSPVLSGAVEVYSPERTIYLYEFQC